VVCHDLGVLLKRDERVVAWPTLVGHEDDAVACVGQLFDCCCVAFESAVVLDRAIFDRRVEVETDENALFGFEIVDRVE